MCNLFKTLPNVCPYTWMEVKVRSEPCPPQLVLAGQVIQDGKVDLLEQVLVVALVSEGVLAPARDVATVVGEHLHNAMVVGEHLHNATVVGKHLRNAIIYTLVKSL